VTRRRFVRSIGLLGPLLLAAGGCGSVREFFDPESGKSAVGIERVEDLLERIEQVHVESELSKERARDVVAALQSIAAPDFAGDAQEGYAAFANAIRQSQEQGEKLRAAVAPMKETAAEVFDRWAKDLESFASPRMRQRSQLRLEAARERYEAIVSAVEPAQWEYDALNRGVADVGLFLSHDFNSESVAAIEREVRVATEHHEGLARRFDQCLVAAEAYVHAAAPHGQVDAPASDDESVPSASKPERLVRGQS
jgi:hypothetical protein